MRLSKGVLSIVLLTLFATNNVVGQQADKPLRFFERSAEGWFWYQDPPEPAPPKEEEPPPPPPAPEPKIVEEPPKEVKPTEPPAVFSVEWLNENLPKYLNLAIDNPTPENVRNYLLLQKMSMDKAQAFAEMQQLVSVGDPFLDETTNRPTATAEAQALERRVQSNAEKIISGLAKETGLFVFYDHTEPSMSVLHTLKMFHDYYGMEIIPVSVDGKDFPGNPFASEKVKFDQGQAQLLNIKAYPAIFLANPKDNTFAPIAQAAIALNELRDRIMISAVRDGIITQDQFNSTKAVYALDNNLAKVFDKASSDELTKLRASMTNEKGFVQPEALSDFLKRHTQ